MKILIIGGKGTIGSKLVHHFSQEHEVLSLGRTYGHKTVDISNSESLEKLFQQIGKVDAVISVAGEAKWAPFNELSEEDYYIGIKSKLMGQVNLVRIAQHYLKPNGSITLSTGILADDPVVQTASAAMVNGAIHSFVRAAALEIKNNSRVNVVSLGVVEDAYEKYRDFFPGHNPIPMSKVVNAYVRSVLGSGHGEIIRIYD